MHGGFLSLCLVGCACGGARMWPKASVGAFCCSLRSTFAVSVVLRSQPARIGSASKLNSGSLKAGCNFVDASRSPEAISIWFLAVAFAGSDTHSLSARFGPFLFNGPVCMATWLLWQLREFAGAVRVPQVFPHQGWQ